MTALLQRWLFFLLGGAVFTPYGLLAVLAVPTAAPTFFGRLDQRLLVAGEAVVILGLIAATSLIPIVRALEAVAVPALLGGYARSLVVTPPRTAAARLRNGAWFVGHTCGGAVISLASIFTVSAAIRLPLSAAEPGPLASLGVAGWTVPEQWAVPVALVLVAAVVAVVTASGALASWLAPILLGPDPVAQLEELERRASRLAERDRIAQQLHDSLGHALTVTTLQASAARKVLDTNPAFAAEALQAIENTGRAAAAELDNVLGMLRDESRPADDQPTLTDLPALVAAHRNAGMPITLELDVTAVAAPISRQLYRVVQEGLTNVQRHAGLVATSVRLAESGEHLVARVHNASGAATLSRSGGGHGIAGMRQRVAPLGGAVSAGPVADGWLLEVRVPKGGEG